MFTFLKLCHVIFFLFKFWFKWVFYVKHWCFLCKTLVFLYVKRWCFRINLSRPVVKGVRRCRPWALKRFGHMFHFISISKV
jgi:hypothetical protein